MFYRKDTYKYRGLAHRGEAPPQVLPEEKSWMLAAAHGNIKKLESLLKEYPSLAKKKDFVMGYTALHWAAKLGRTDIVKFIMGANVDIHSKSHGGYTPLHIAAMSGRDQVIVQLIELYNANIHTRDHSGKKPRDVVKDTVAADVQRKLGRSLILEPDWMLKDASVVRKSSAQLTHITLPSPKSGDRRLGRNFRPSIST
uniref:Uncharacterized protein n=1 Tax=Clytia hemisphaerica TaxID=252671 RepID=A0A7M5U350_9CNID